jgi:uncharacterized protein involved in exopolysaccharide biosynthesis
MNDRNRILELALESLENKKKQIDQEIAEITRELRGRSPRRPLAATQIAASSTARARKRPRFSKEERIRRSQRMKAYWENWRKKRSRPK